MINDLFILKMEDRGNNKFIFLIMLIPLVAFLIFSLIFFINNYENAVNWKLAALGKSGNNFHTHIFSSSVCCYYK